MLSSNQFSAYKIKNSIGSVIIPAQQIFVMELATTNGLQYI